MDRTMVADALKQFNKSAIMELSRGHFEKALELFRHSARIEESLGLRGEQARTLYNIANAFFIMHDAEQALQNCREAAVLFEQERMQSDLMRAKLLEGTILVFMKQADQARKVLDDALRKADSDEIRAEAYIQLHHVSQLEGDFGKSQELISRAIRCLESCQRADRLKAALSMRAALFVARNRKDLAAMDLNRIASLEEEQE